MLRGQYGIGNGDKPGKQGNNNMYYVYGHKNTAVPQHVFESFGDSCLAQAIEFARALTDTDFTVTFIDGTEMDWAEDERAMMDAEKKPWDGLIITNKILRRFFLVFNRDDTTTFESLEYECHGSESYEQAGRRICKLQGWDKKRP